MIEMFVSEETTFQDILKETREALRALMANGGRDYNAINLARQLKEITPSIDWNHTVLNNFASGSFSGKLMGTFDPNSKGKSQITLDDMLKIHAFATTHIEQVAAKLREAGRPNVRLEHFFATAKSSRLEFRLITPVAEELARNPDFMNAARAALRSLVKAYTAGARDGYEARVSPKKITRREPS